MILVPLQLQAQSSIPLDTVRITAVSRIPTSLVTPLRSVEVIDRPRLERMAAVTVADYVAITLGVDVRGRSPAQADVSLRGSTFEQVLVLVDGVRVSDAQTGHFNLDLAVPLDLIERIEILRGPGSAVYGADAVGGVINVVTRRGSSSADARAWGGTFSSLGGAVSGGSTTGPLRVSGGTDYAKSDGHRPGTDFELVQGRLGAELSVGGGRLRSDVGIGARDFGAADFYAPYPSHERTRSSTATVRYESRPDSPWSVGVTASTRRHSDLFTLVREDPAIYQNSHVSWQSTGELVARYAPADPWGVAFGGEANDLRLRSARLGDRNETRSAVFSEATLGRPRGAMVNVGIRADRSSTYGEFVSPSAAVAVPLHSSALLRGSVSRGFRAPTWTDRFYEDPGNVGEPDLRAERFIGSEIGLRLFPSSRISVDVAGFARDAKDVIEWAKPVGATPATPWRTMNIASATYRGIEAQVSAPDLLGVDWRIQATGLRFEPKGADGFAGKYALRPVTRTLGLSASAPILPSLRLSLDGVHVTRQDEGSHLLANARLAFGWRAVALTVDVLNLANDTYLDASAKDAAGRAVYVGARWSLR
ncbi:MAG: TonB-dependent receptor [Gemmatimonadaceae bacterium]|nr:TonB-dependent receptor [Gemmatimonadaceae bacterium]